MHCKHCGKELNEHDKQQLRDDGEYDCRSCMNWNTHEDVEGDDDGEI